MDPILPTKQPYASRGRQNRRGTALILRYCILALLGLLVYGICDQRNVLSAVSEHIPSALSHFSEVQGPNNFNSPNDNISTTPNDNGSQWAPKDLYTSPTTHYPKFGKCTASFGDPDPPYEAAIASHALHNEIHGYPHCILREHMIRGLWSKHGWIMTIIGQELAKPEEQRLQWLLWHDRDTVLMNPQIPLDIFVPPDPEFSHIHLLVTNDRNGLNNGVFMVRVNQWAFKLFASALSIREYQPEIVLKYTEQSGMEEAIKRPWWASNVAYVPQRWFNGFPPDTEKNEDNNRAHSREGSLLIHFASNRDGLRPQRMAHWGEIARNRTSAWDTPVELMLYQEEIAEFWQRVGKGESYEKINKDIGGRMWSFLE
ncbi:uncharacterized protein N0V89_004814 [Didymosphaeria variabile]|uniref:Galactosyl transferase GMA12/MNN10 family protein n=1 Tax=Didymosphaeria variabile TaxID=1932322 RepID=A0A9W8XSW8_9PLEO|nr:uncharacterized protein N0V89_004814 [Didymosphaeria variabile]KAJ4356778.1 hypothetical protein N0V89_004814 [Didymosphaeria variabile]